VCAEATEQYDRAKELEVNHSMGPQGLRRIHLRRNANGKAKSHAENAQQVGVATACAKLEEATKGMLVGILRSRRLKDSVSGGHGRIVREARMGVKPIDPTTFVADEIGRLPSRPWN